LEVALTRSDHGRMSAIVPAVSTKGVSCGRRTTVSAFSRLSVTSGGPLRSYQRQMASLDADDGA